MDEEESHEEAFKPERKRSSVGPDGRICGWLTKKPEGLGFSHKRWFEFHEGTMTYYDKEGGHKKGEFQCTDAAIELKDGHPGSQEGGTNSATFWLHVPTHPVKAAPKVPEVTGAPHVPKSSSAGACALRRDLGCIAPCPSGGALCRVPRSARGRRFAVARDQRKHGRNELTFSSLEV